MDFEQNEVVTKSKTLRKKLFLFLLIFILFISIYFFMMKLTEKKITRIENGVKVTVSINKVHPFSFNHFIVKAKIKNTTDKNLYLIGSDGCDNGLRISTNSENLRYVHHRSTPFDKYISCSQSQEFVLFRPNEEVTEKNYYEYMNKSEVPFLEGELRKINTGFIVVENPKEYFSSFTEM